MERQELKEFYETEVRAKSKNLPPFEFAHHETIKSIEKSITFALWRFKKALNRLKEILKNE